MLGKKIKKVGLLSTLILSGLLLSFLYSLPSCQKNMDCKAVITILDTLSRPCANAAVSLQYNTVSAGPQTTTVTTQNTDGTGTTTFIFKEPAIYDVDVTYKGKRDTLGIIKLVQGSTVSQTFTFR